MTRIPQRRLRSNSPTQDGPDWRTAFGEQPAARATSSQNASTIWRATGIVAAVDDAPWAMQSRVRSIVIALSLVAVAVLWFVTGRAAQAGRHLEAWLVGALAGPLLILVLVLVFLPRLGAAVIEVLFLLIGLRPRLPRLGHGRGAYGGRQLTLIAVDSPAFYLGMDERLGEEVLVATTRRIPAGSVIRVWGPRIAGVRHACIVRQEQMRGTIVARGLIGSLIVVAGCGYLDVWMLASVAR